MLILEFLIKEMIFLPTIIPKSLYKKAISLNMPMTEGLVLGCGNLKPLFLAIGEAPGENEIYTNKPFSGRAGKELDFFYHV